MLPGSPCTQLHIIYAAGVPGTHTHTHIDTRTQASNLMENNRQPNKTFSLFDLDVLAQGLRRLGGKYCPQSITLQGGFLHDLGQFTLKGRLSF